MTTPALTATARPIAPTALSRWTVFLLGVSFYAVGVFGLCWLIGCSLGVIPFTGGPLQTGSTAGAVAVNVALVALFGIQHAIMARPWFKARWTRIVPPALERSIFTLTAGALMALTMGLWQPMSASIWSVGGAAGTGLLILGALGWAYLFVSTFALDHFELFGLRQVYAHLRGGQAQAPSFKRRLMYRFDRHPLMSGALIGLWACPVMTLDRLVLALALSSYVVIGVFIEERDLVRAHGETYRSYRREVGSLVPVVGWRRR